MTIPSRVVPFVRSPFVIRSPFVRAIRTSGRPSQLFHRMGRQAFTVRHQSKAKPYLRQKRLSHLHFKPSIGLQSKRGISTSNILSADRAHQRDAQGLGSSSIWGELVEEWKSSAQSISLYCSANHFLARIQDQAGSETEIDSAHIKCGILGKIPHHRLIQTINQLTKEKIKEHITVCCYPTQGQSTEVWIFEAVQGAAPWIKKAKENLKQGDSEKEEKAIDCYQQALKLFETALKIQEDQKGNTTELNSAILQLKKELFLLQIKDDLSLYLSSEQERTAFNEIIEKYKEKDLFSRLSEYFKAHQESNLSPCQLFLSAWMDEHFNRPDSAIQNYLRLAEHHPDPLPCFKKAEKLVKETIKSDPFALPHFLEKLDREKLIQLGPTTHYLEDLERLILQKDVTRMTFEKCLATLNQHSQQTKAPTCFICFNVEEDDVGKWLEQVLIPDLDRMGIQPLFCFRDLHRGKGELNRFQGLIRGADQVMVICTPNLRRKCEERIKSPTGVAQEIRLAKERYNDSDKDETIFLLYLKGTRKESCPSEFFEPILGIKLNKSQESSIFSYYANAFELFGGMRNIPRAISRQVKEDFLLQTNKIFAGEINREDLEKWRQAKQSQIEGVLKAVQERVTKMTLMAHLPLSPKDFTGRQQELQDLYTACQHHSRVAITGLGGVGKTALALKYANDHRTDYQFIYLIPAGPTHLIRDGLLQLADDLHLPKIEKIEERLELLKRRLDQFEQKYLLIFDGIDQVEAYDELTKYLPKRGNCLLLTSRMPEQSRIREFEIIKLKPFSLEEAVSYLLRVTGSEEKEKAGELAERLGRLPLALKHAAGYICSCGISIHEYIQKFDRLQLKLFENERLDLLTKEERTILTTWNISLNAIETVHKCPLAKEVIAFFAFLGQAPISLDLVKAWFATAHSNGKELELDDALKHLRGYSMIDSPSSDFYQVHPVVQQVTHHQMANPQQVFERAFRTLALRLMQFQEEDVNTWKPIRPTIPHALSLFKRQNLMENISIEEQHKFMVLLGKFYHTHGNFYRALEIGQASLKVAQLWNKQHPQHEIAGIALVASYNNIGLSLRNLGKFDEALEQHQKVLEILLRMCGEKHPSIVESYNNIGLSLESLGKHDEALEYQQRALKVKLKLYGGEDPILATNYNSAGISCRSLGKYDDALEYFQKALKIWLKTYNEEHPNVASIYANIGGCLQSLGKYEETLEQSQKALKIMLKLHGEEHPDVAAYYNNIGVSLDSLGKYNAALEYKQKALKILLKLYGEEHPTVASILDNIGFSLKSLGKYNEALEYKQKALKLWLKVCGEEHPDVATCYSNIGVNLGSLGKYDDALECSQKALKILLKLRGKEHPDVATTYNNIGGCLESLEKYDEAILYFRKALKIWLKVYGEEHTNIAIAFDNIGGCLESLGKYNESLDYHQKALKIWLMINGEEHSNLSINYDKIGTSLMRMGKHNEALEYQQKALKIRLKVYDEEHPDVALSYNNIGLSLYNLKKYDKALEYHQKAVEIFERTYPSTHPGLVMARQNLDTVLNKMGKKRSGS